jgi:hypothetical protein
MYTGYMVIKITESSTEKEPKAMTQYDYENQCWIIDGIIQSCAHPDAMRCDCYGRLHAGECAACGHKPL